MLAGVLLVLPLEVPDCPSALAGTPPLLLTFGGITSALPLSTGVGAVEGAGAPVEGPGELLPDVGAPEVSGIGPTPAEPLLPPPRLSGAEGVLTSTPLLGVPASERPLLLVPEPTAAGVLPGLDSLRRSQPLSINNRSEATVRLVAERTKAEWIRGACSIKGLLS